MEEVGEKRRVYFWKAFTAGVKSEKWLDIESGDEVMTQNIPRAKAEREKHSRRGSFTFTSH